MASLVDALNAIHKGESQQPSWRITLRWNARRERFFATKYVVERVIGWVLLVSLSPVMLLLWLMVKFTSRGPGFYRQTRVGLNQRTFEIVKLRSMTLDAEQEGRAFWSSKNDCRTTWFGKILRAFYLDELPQLLNVARGEMVLIGPRPERPLICDELQLHIDDYFDRVTVKPGITGLSQINLPPDSSLRDVQRKQALDILYINKTNFWLELRILLVTALRMIGINCETVIKWMHLCRRSILEDMGLMTPVRTTSKRGARKRHSSVRVPNGSSARPNRSAQQNPSRRQSNGVVAEGSAQQRSEGEKPRKRFRESLLAMPFISDSDSDLDLTKDTLDASSSGISLDG